MSAESASWNLLSVLLMAMLSRSWKQPFISAFQLLLYHSVMGNKICQKTGRQHAISFSFLSVCFSIEILTSIRSGASEAPTWIKMSPGFQWKWWITGKSFSENVVRLFILRPVLKTACPCLNHNSIEVHAETSKWKKSMALVIHKNRAANHSCLMLRIYEAITFRICETSSLGSR